MTCLPLPPWRLLLLSPLFMWPFLPPYLFSDPSQSLCACYSLHLKYFSQIFLYQTLPLHSGYITGGNRDSLKIQRPCKDGQTSTTSKTPKSTWWNEKKKKGFEQTQWNFSVGHSDTILQQTLDWSLDFLLNIVAVNLGIRERWNKIHLISMAQKELWVWVPAHVTY